MKRTLFLLAFLFVSACGQNPEFFNSNNPSNPSSDQTSKSDLSLIDFPNWKDAEIYLSIDGGSMLGMIPLVLLEDIEKQTNQPIHKLVKGIVGTSTGAIVAGLMGLPINVNEPYSATQGLTFYKEAKTHAFSDENILQGQKVKMQQAMETKLKETFHDVNLSTALVHMMIPSYQNTTNDKGLFIFDSQKAKNNSDLDLVARQAINASTAITAYFRPAAFNFNGADREFIDLADTKKVPAELQVMDPTFLIHNHLAANLPKNSKAVIYSLGTGFIPGPSQKTIDAKNKDSNIKIIRIDPDLKPICDKVRQALNDNTMPENIIILHVLSPALDKATNDNVNFVTVDSIKGIEAAGQALKSSPEYKFMLKHMMERAKLVH